MSKPYIFLVPLRAIWMVPLRRYYQEALANGEIGTGGYTKSTGNCSGPVYYKKWVSCKSGGTEECSPSDC